MTGGDGGPSESERDESSPTRERAVAIDADTAFDLLADAERRAILRRLRNDADRTATVAELVDAARRSRGGEGRRGESETSAKNAKDEPERKGADAVAGRDRVGVYHRHLPKLADAGVVECDRRSETVRYWGNAFLEALLDACRTAEATGVADVGRLADDSESATSADHESE